MTELKTTEKQNVYTDSDTIFAINLVSCIMGLIGIFVFLSSFIKDYTIEPFPAVFGGVLVLQGVLTIFYSLGLFPISIWGWLDD